MRVRLELANAGVEVGDAASGGKVRERAALEIGNLRAGIEEHPIVGAGNLGGENRDAHELRQMHGLAAMRQLGCRNGERAAGDIKNVVEAPQHVCAKKADARDADKASQRRGGKSEVTAAKPELLASYEDAAGSAEAGRCSRVE